MIKHYTFNYDDEAEVCFMVDTNKFTLEHAKATLEFFIWEYDEEADPIDEVMKKYAMQAIEMGTKGNYNLLGVKEEFNELEGFMKVDGSSGITLNIFSGYEFDEEKLYVEIKSTHQ